MTTTDSLIKNAGDYSFTIEDYPDLPKAILICRRNANAWASIGTAMVLANIHAEQLYIPNNLDFNVLLNIFRLTLEDCASKTEYDFLSPLVNFHLDEPIEFVDRLGYVPQYISSWSDSENLDESGWVIVIM